ncbi:hypothetical protein BU23DRAFT_125497 [Bimuria novae-zelandiae CBS 107.79]|uniref:Uncharacterized protein n=1 Tax=Bimuria novae-zelandiae CBS 107.79 TaxID=1447943 RepID=A0A6A5VAM1_9PLEO|nr:hypothetical protein BU23DRAFT_125497 [Bimuria novae-zelandiae CBS 107.79]
MPNPMLTWCTIEFADNNDLWAHVEVFASIITACFPTLGPLFRSHRGLESLIGSIRSLFSIHSRSRSTVNLPSGSLHHKPPGTSLEGDRRAWYELSTKGSEPATVSRGTTHDVDTGIQRSDAIMVRQTLSVEDSASV